MPIHNELNSRSLPGSIRQPLIRVSDLLRRIESDCPQSDTLARDILPRYRPAMLDAMHNLGAAIDAFLTSQPPAAEIKAVYQQVTGPIRAWSATSPFFHHSFTKPRGYPGDFETIEIIYDCCPAGEDLPGLVFDDYYLHARPAQAVRNRLAYLVERLGAEVGQRSAGGHRPVRLLSLGCGPARELALLAQRPEFAAVADVTCLDMDPAALACARQHIDGRLDGQVHFVCDNALRYARSAQRPAEPFDVIYAAGLFDYLSPDLASRLVEDCYGLLAPGGVLIVGNFSLETHPSDRVLIDWLLDWHLLYRNEADYRAIFARTSFGPVSLHFEYEPLRANLFVVAPCKPVAGARHLNSHQRSS